MSALKLVVILLYLAGILAAFTDLLGSAGPYLVWVSVGIFIAHIFELAVAYKYLGRYSGGMAQSILLSLLFGAIHWLPLKKASEAN